MVGHHIVYGIGHRDIIKRDILILFKISDTCIRPAPEISVKNIHCIDCIMGSDRNYSDPCNIIENITVQDGILAVSAEICKARISGIGINGIYSVKAEILCTAQR